MTVCQPANNVPDFTWAMHKQRLPEYALETDPGVVQCLTTLTPPNSTNCASFTSWSQWTGAACSLIVGATSIVVNEVNDKKLKSEIYNGLGALYNIIAGINHQFIQAITDINNNKPYEPIDPPTNAPTFPPIGNLDGFASAISGFWGAAEPFLQMAISKVTAKDPGSIWIKVLEGVIAGSQDAIANIVALVNIATGKTPPQSAVLTKGGPAGGNGNGEGKHRGFSGEEIAEILADDFNDLITSLGDLDLTSPERVYADTKRIMEKIAEETAERARIEVEKRS